MQAHPQHQSSSSEDDDFQPPSESSSDESIEESDDETTGYNPRENQRRQNQYRGYGRRGERNRADFVPLDRNSFLIAAAVLLLALCVGFLVQYQMLIQQTLNSPTSEKKFNDLSKRLSVLEEVTKFHSEDLGTLRTQVRDMSERQLKYEYLMQSISASSESESGSHSGSKSPTSSASNVRVLIVFEKEVENGFVEWFKANIHNSDVTVQLVRAEEILASTRNIAIFPETDLILQIHRVISPKIDGFWNQKLWEALDRVSDHGSIFVSLRNVGEKYDDPSVSPPEIRSPRKIEIRGREPVFHDNLHNRDALAFLSGLIAQRKAHLAAATSV